MTKFFANGCKFFAVRIIFFVLIFVAVIGYANPAVNVRLSFFGTTRAFEIGIRTAFEERNFGESDLFDALSENAAMKKIQQRIIFSVGAYFFALIFFVVGIFLIIFFLRAVRASNADDSVVGMSSRACDFSRVTEKNFAEEKTEQENSLSLATEKNFAEEKTEQENLLSNSTRKKNRAINFFLFFFATILHIFSARAILSVPKIVADALPIFLRLFARVQIELGAGWWIVLFAMIAANIYSLVCQTFSKNVI